MEASRKRRSGFAKSKLNPFYRSRNKHVSSVIPSSSSSLPPPSFAYKDYMIATPNQNSSFLVQPDACNFIESNRIYKQLDTMFGPGDEHVDAKAAVYISAVQERFMLDDVV